MLGLGKKQPDKWNKKFGERIKEAREKENLTQKELATAIDKKQESVSDLERGRTEVNAFDLVIIATHLGKKITFFYQDFPRVLETKPDDLSHDEEDLIRYFRDIQNSAMEKLALDQVKRLAETSIEADLKARKEENNIAREELQKVDWKNPDDVRIANQRTVERIEKLRAKKKKK
jgi:transcriptional regulator with XRE-family HTH domain